MPDEVLLELAFSWKCPSCGKRNFVNGVAVEWTEDDMRAQLGVKPWEEVPEEVREEMSECVAAPMNVSCVCGGRFKAVDPGINPVGGKGL
jgi:hypothetical protein